MMGKKKVVYLASFANTRFGCSPATVPLEIGYIKAYAMSALSGEVEIQLHRTFESLYKALQVNEPDIIGCSWYGWNRCLTTNALSFVKSKFPGIMTVVGGANVPEKPEYMLEDFNEFPCIDVAIPNDGEIPFLNLLNVFMRGGREGVFKTVIDGAFYPSDSRKKVVGNMIPQAEDINIFPSPYLNGDLDEFLNNAELMPIIQTTRGCPFRCSFCVAAKDSWNKIRMFDTERVKSEIDYLGAKAKNRTIRFTDENFGIAQRDLEIARFIAKKRKDSGYPDALRVYTHKQVSDRVKKIVLLLKDLIPLNISCQTLTEPVLKNIGRKNTSLDKFKIAVDWAHKNNINIATEAIFGLPGETLKSFTNVINHLVDLRVDSVAVGTLMMLKETEINRPEQIKKHGYKVMYGTAERGYTKAEQFENVEIDEWAVENNYFNFEEYLRINIFKTVYHLFMFWGYFKEVVYAWENRGVKVSDVIYELLDNPGHYPFFAQRLGKLRECIKDDLFNTKEDARRVLSQRFSEENSRAQYAALTNPLILIMAIHGEMIHSSNQEEMTNEAIGAATEVFKRRGGGDLAEFLEEMEFGKALIKNVIIPFWEKPEETIVFPSRYDLISWRNQNYRGALSGFTLKKTKEYKLRIRSLNEFLNFVRWNSKKPFYAQSELFFRSFRSNNVRRYIV